MTRWIFFGGSWSDYPQCARVAFRVRFTPGNRDYYLGLRLAKSPIQRVRKDERDG